MEAGEERQKHPNLSPTAIPWKRHHETPFAFHEHQPCEDLRFFGQLQQRVSAQEMEAVLSLFVKPTSTSTVYPPHEPKLLAL